MSDFDFGRGCFDGVFRRWFLITEGSSAESKLWVDPFVLPEGTSSEFSNRVRASLRADRRCNQCWSHPDCRSECHPEPSFSHWSGLGTVLGYWVPASHCCRGHTSSRRAAIALGY